MLKSFSLTFLLIAVCLLTLQAQDPSYINYNTKDGLPSSEVYDVEVDQNGLVWFTTDRGVCTYDGYIFKNYTTKDGLADNTNFEIYRDSKNRLWFNGYNGRLSFYEKERFYPYMANDSLVSLLGTPWIANLMEAGKETFYLTVFKSKSVALFKLGINSLPFRIDDIFIKDSLDLITIGTDTLICFKEDGFFFYPNTPSSKSSFNAVKWNNSWLIHGRRTLYQSDFQGNILQQLDFQVDIGNAYFDDQSNLWLCTSDGLYYYENGDLKKPPITFLKNYNVTSITKDRESNFWITTLQNGVMFIPAFDINVYQTPVYRNTNERILAIGKLDMHIYFGTSDSRILAIDSVGNIQEVLNNKNTNAQLKYFSKIKNELNTYEFNIKEKDGKILLSKIGYSHIYSKHLKNDDHIKFFDGGFTVFNPGNNNSFSSVNAKPAFKKRVTTFEQDSNDDIWVGTLSGLYKVTNYDYQNIQPILLQSRDTFGRINDIHLDRFDHRWIATIGNGLFYHTTDKVFQIKEKDGINSDLINHIYMSNDSTLWIGTNQGLNVFNYRYENDSLTFLNIKSLTTVDGLPSNFVNDVDYWNHHIWLATDDGICAFDPDIVNRFAPVVPISIKEFIVSDSSYVLSDKLVLGHDQNDVFINFTGISFRKEKEGTFYRYRLISDNKTPPWFYTNEKNIRYNDLPPGKYTFEVSAQNKSKQWNESPAVIAFEIKPHFSQTTWFRILTALVILGTIGLFVFFQIKRIRSREAEKRQLQEAQLRTREAELAALRNQMNPHFVFNSLNSIQNFIFKKDTRKANHYLSKFAALMRNSLQYTRLDFITLREELSFLKDYLELEAMRFPDKFECKFIVDEEVDIADLKIPSLLLQPVLENVVKHAFKNREAEGLIEVEINKQKADYLHIYIRDNGPGLPADQKVEEVSDNKHKSLGIQIIKNRIALLNEANHTVKSNVTFTNRNTIDATKTGLEVHFVLPILYKGVV